MAQEEAVVYHKPLYPDRQQGSNLAPISGQSSVLQMS